MPKRQRAPKPTVLNLTRAWKLQAAIEHLFDVLETLVPPTPALHWSRKAFEEFQKEFNSIRAVDAPKVAPTPAGGIIDALDVRQ